MLLEMLSRGARHSSMSCSMVRAGGLFSCTQGYVLAGEWRGPQHMWYKLHHSLCISIADCVGWQTSCVPVSTGTESIPGETGFQVFQPLLGDSVQKYECLPAHFLSTVPEDSVCVLTALAGMTDCIHT